MKNQFLLTPYFLDAYSAELEALAQPGWGINKLDLPAGRQQQRVSACLRRLADLVAGAVAVGERPVSIAGDCCTAIAFLAGLRKAGIDPTLIWLDAHGDFNTWETSPSGFLGGMPLAMLVGRGEQTLLEAVGLEPFPESQVILCDARDLDAGERQALAASQVTHLSNIQALTEPALRSRPLYVHFDTDIVNPDEAPAMSYRAPGGPSAAEVRAVFRSLAQTGQIVGVSVSTWRPELDPDGRSQAVCMDLLHSLIG